MKRVRPFRAAVSVVFGLCLLADALPLPCPAWCQSSVKQETLADGVEHWYVPRQGDDKSLFAKQFEEVYKIIVPSSKQPFGKSVAFLAGVSKYEHLSPQLPSVQNDLMAMREFLLNRAGFDEVYVAKDAVVSRDLIERYIKGKFGKELTENDRLLFYYSGHGGDNQGRTGYMQFGKAQKDEFWGPQVLAINVVEDWSREIRVKHILFLLDCCASGLAFTAKSGSGDSDKLLLQTLSGNGSRTVLTAGTADEKTYALSGRDNIGNGVFTKALLNAYDWCTLSSQSAGLITISDLYAGIEKEMAKFRAQQQKTTTPRLWTLQEGDFRGTFVFLNPKASTARLTPDQAKSLGVTATPKGEGQEAGIIETFSTNGGVLYIDRQNMGRLLPRQTGQFLQQPVGKHLVELAATGGKEAKEVLVESGKIAYISFGVKSPFGEAGQPMGTLVMESIEQASGDVYIDNYKVGVLAANSRVDIADLTVGTHQYRVESSDRTRSVSGEVQIEKGQSTWLSVRPSPPRNLRIIVN
jgi:uncharacterized caspase-like protein